MVEFDVPINEKQRVAYIPKVLIEVFGHRVKILPNTRAAIIYAEGTPPEQVLESLAIIQQDLELRVKRPKGARSK
ncbi:MAG: hypothetical protein AUJ07_08685 [Crenarchaeota archaeon 13_1_40CM_3_53_5]|nr:MAG: hypothetical protein AUJ07_08685 [Crenarchaeota archaeon 13_1_40CM_3_53_5]